MSYNPTICNPEDYLPTFDRIAAEEREREELTGEDLAQNFTSADFEALDSLLAAMYRCEDIAPLLIDLKARVDRVGDSIVSERALRAA